MLFYMNSVLLMTMMTMMIRHSLGHGIMLEPPSRASMWRVEGFHNATSNTNDMGQNCGGLYRQHGENNGKCGICGDPWDGPREHEAGGKYANGVITRQYDTNAVISVTIEITASHLGYFEFRICPNNDIATRATKECLDHYLLRQTNGDKKFFYGSTRGGYTIMLQLPTELECSQCVLQWRWRTGNNWGVCPSGKSRRGCGRQEEFYSCADVSIGHSGSTSPRPDSTSITPGTNTIPSAGPTDISPEMTATAIAPTISSTSSLSQWYTTSSTTPVPVPTQSSNQWSTTQSPTPVPAQTTTVGSQCKATDAFKSAAMDKWCAANCMTGFCPDAYCTCSDDARQPGSNCVPTQAFKGSVGMDLWCKQNCALGFCPASHCVCSDDAPQPGMNCEPTQTYASQSGMVDWCHQNCALGFCPQSHCICR